MVHFIIEAVEGMSHPALMLHPDGVSAMHVRAVQISGMMIKRTKTWKRAFIMTSPFSPTEYHWTGNTLYIELTARPANGRPVTSITLCRIQRFLKN